MSLANTAILNSAPPARSPRPAFSPFESPETVDVLGFKLMSASLAKAAYWIANRAQAGISTQVSFLNAHCVNVARKDWRYRDSLTSADALLPDGSGIELAARMEGKVLGENLNGTDLFGPLCRCLAFRRIPVFFLGGREGVARDAAANAAAAHPGLKVAGTRNGYFSPREEDAVIRQINESGARVVFVAFGVPDQDVWIARVRHRLNAPVLLGVGGLLDFVSGRIPRAPLWMRRLGVEWVYRLKCEPQRMWRRYLVGNFSFVAYAAGRAFAPVRKRLVRRTDRSLARMVDIAASGAGLLALSPLLLATAAAIRLDSRGPVLFRQVRIGEDGQPFEMVKFRSMKVGGPSQEELRQASNDRDDGVTFKLKRDPRITAVGRFIRKYSIDELPQLWNVLKGDMSLVGPRPALPSEVEKYTPVERRRLRGKPGITCLWQISGRADLPFDRQVVLDVAYLKRRSVLLDLLILLKTPVAVLTARGAY